MPRPKPRDPGPPPNPYTARPSTPDDHEVIRGWRKMDKEVSELVYTWTRWKRWESDPPIVAVRAGALTGEHVVGYHAVSFSKSGYANSASQFVHPEHRGRGVAGLMIDHLLQEALRRGCTRLRFRTPQHGPGLDCWRGLGAEPFGCDDRDYWFDLPLAGVSNISDFIRLAPAGLRRPTRDARTLNYYLRSGLVPLVDEWRSALSGE